MCGECGGDNSSCQVFKQTYNETLYGYRPIIVIPKGAMNVNITQTADIIENNTGNFIGMYNNRKYLFYTCINSMFYFSH